MALLEAGILRFGELRRKIWHLDVHILRNRQFDAMLDDERPDGDKLALVGVVVLQVLLDLFVHQHLGVLRQVHHALRHVDAPSDDVLLAVDVSNPAVDIGVQANAQLERLVGVAPGQGFEREKSGPKVNVGSGGEKVQNHAVTGGERDDVFLEPGIKGAQRGVDAVAQHHLAFRLPRRIEAGKADHIAEKDFVVEGYAGLC